MVLETQGGFVAKHEYFIRKTLLHLKWYTLQINTIPVVIMEKQRR